MDADGTFAWAPGADVDDPTRSGKWMVFTSPEYHAEVWEKLKAATKAGELGTAAKTGGDDERVRFALDLYAKRVASGEQPRMKAMDDLTKVYARIKTRALLTCVYTHDFEDHDDVRRVLVALRGLGFNGRLSYKRDLDTLQGHYSDGVSIYVSQPGSLDFEDRRPELRGYE